MDPKDNGCCDDDGGHECMSAAVVAHRDTAPVLDPTEHVLDFVALAVERGIVGMLDFTVLAWRDAWIDAFVDQGGAKLVAVVAPVTEQFLGRWQGIKHQSGTLMVAHLPFREQHDDRTSFTVTNRVQFGVQTSFCAPDMAGNSLRSLSTNAMHWWNLGPLRPFLSRLAAVR